MKKQTDGLAKKKYRLLDKFETTAKKYKKGDWIALTDIGYGLLKSKKLIK